MVKPILVWAIIMCQTLAIIAMEIALGKGSAIVLLAGSFIADVCAASLFLKNRP